MHINVSFFKFGNTPLYSINGVVSQGIIRTVVRAARDFRSAGKAGRGSLAYALFAVSVVLFLASLVYTSGRSYAARASYAFSTLRAELPASAVLLPPSLTRLPLSDPVSPLTEAAPIFTAPTLSIPKLNVSAPIVETSASFKNIDADLKEGVIRWPSGAEYGKSGAVVLLGHSSAPLAYRGAYGSVFALLDKLETGDVISLESGSSGMTLTYRVTDRLIVNPKTYKEDFQNLKGENLVLVSCWPVGSRFQRIAVRAERIYN